jgi:DNA-binding beta-propeller fold protein YncE
MHYTMVTPLPARRPRGMVALAAAAVLFSACRENLVRPPREPVRAPVLIFITPSEVPQTAAAVNLTVIGENFTDSSVVRFNGADRPTTFVSPTELRAALGVAQLQEPGTSLITVYTPPLGGGESGTALFVVTAVSAGPDSAPIPRITRLLPSEATQSDPTTRLIIYGSGFAERTVVRWNGVDLPTYYSKDTRIVALVGSELLQAPGPAGITVYTSPPRGGVSAPHPFAVIEAAPGHPQAWDILTVPVADAPRFVAVAPNGVAYAARASTDSILQVDVATGRNLGSFPAGRGPGDFALAAAGTTLWITSAADSSLVAVDVGSSATRRLPLPAAPRRILAGDAALFVSTADARLMRIDPASGAVLATTTLGAPGEGMLLSADGARLWVASGNQVAELAGADLALVRSVTLESPVHELAAGGGGATLYVATESQVEILAAATLARQEPLPLEGAFGIALTPDGTQLWVTQPDQGRATVYDVAGRRVLGIIYTQGIPRQVRFSADGLAAIVASEGGAVLVIR